MHSEFCLFGSPMTCVDGICLLLDNVLMRQVRPSVLLRRRLPAVPCIQRGSGMEYSYTDVDWY